MGDYLEEDFGWEGGEGCRGAGAGGRVGQSGGEVLLFGGFLGYASRVLAVDEPADLVESQFFVFHCVCLVSALFE